MTVYTCVRVYPHSFFSLSLIVELLSTFFFLFSLLFFLEIELLVNHPWNKYKCVTWTAFNMVYSHYNPVNRSQSSIGYWKTIPSKRFKDWTILILSILYMYAYNLKNKGNYSFFSSSSCKNCHVHLKFNLWVNHLSLVFTVFRWVSVSVFVRAKRTRLAIEVTIRK